MTLGSLKKYDKKYAGWFACSLAAVLFLHLLILNLLIIHYVYGISLLITAPVSLVTPAAVYFVGFFFVKTFKSRPQGNLKEKLQNEPIARKPTKVILSIYAILVIGMAILFGFLGYSLAELSSPIWAYMVIFYAFLAISGYDMGEKSLLREALSSKYRLSHATEPEFGYFDFDSLQTRIIAISLGVLLGWFVYLFQGIGVAGFIVSFYLGSFDILTNS